MSTHYLIQKRVGNPAYWQTVAYKTTREEAIKAGREIATTYPANVQWRIAEEEGH